jgi:hypothetical protein
MWQVIVWVLWSQFAGLGIWWLIRELRTPVLSKPEIKTDTRLYPPCPVCRTCGYNWQLNGEIRLKIKCWACRGLGYIVED